MTEQKINDKFFGIVKAGTSLLENKDNAELYDKNSLYEYRNVERELRENLKRADEDGRELVIGIVGAVKAGKSSFLNALLFGGEQFLPKAITPSTAALTIISYSEVPKAIVHFFSESDWSRMRELSQVYESRLEENYTQYCQQHEENVKNRENAKSKDKGTTEKSAKQIKLTKQDYEKNFFRISYKDERTKAAHELVQMANDKDIISCLGSEVELDGDIISKLNDYVDANGKYTAIVKYVEIKSDNPGLKGIEVIDTPGLCDPVVSRGQATKDYLSKCDVVLLLSACSQFMPSDTINLMANSLPSAGVKEVLVIGSRYDSGILNDKGGEFLEKAKKAKASYGKQFINNMNIINNSGRNNELTAKIASSPRLYISSMCYVIGKKLKQNKPLDKEEAHIYKQLKEFDGFKDDYLSVISGIGDVKKELNKIIKKKEEIIAAKDSELCSNAANNFAKTLYDIKSYVETNNIKLRNMSKDEIEEQFQRIQDALVLSRKQLSALFETTGLKCEKKLISTKSILTQEMVNFTGFKTSSDTSEETHTENVGFLGLRKETVKTIVVTKKAPTAQVKLNLQNYWARCIQVINDEFTYLFNREQFSRSIKEIIMKAYEAGDNNYAIEDILLPVDKFLVKLTIPEVEVDVNRYVDAVNSHFSKGFATNDEIHELASLQAELLGQIKSEFEEKVSVNGGAISKVMQQESVSFADDLEKKFAGDREQLLNQMNEQQRYIELNATFASELANIITQFKENINAV